MIYGDNYNPKHRDKIKNMLMIKFMLSPIIRIFTLLKKSDNIIVSAKKNKAEITNIRLGFFMQNFLLKTS